MDAYSQGRIAFLADAPIDSNPFPEIKSGLSEWRDWRAGWQAEQRAQQDAQDQGFTS